MTRLKYRYLIPIYLLIAFFLDGSLAYLFQGVFYTPERTIISRLVILLLFLVALILPEEKLILVYALGIGFFYDLYFTGVLGVYTFVVPIIIYLILSVRKVLPMSPLFLALIYLISLTGLESGVYLLDRMVGLVQITPINFISNVLAPTLALNLIFFAGLYLPLKSLLLKLRTSR